MANTRSQNRRSRASRGGNKRTSGSGALVDTVRSTIGQLTGNGRRSSRGGGIASRASGMLGGMLGGRGSSGGGGGRGRRRR